MIENPQKGGPWAPRALFWINLAVKAALLFLLVFGAFSGLQQFEGKAFVWRLATYPIAALVVPVVWYIRYRHTPYPFASDIFLTLPFLIDTAGPYRYRRQCPRPVRQR